MKELKHLAYALLTDESGQDLLEYAFVLGLIGLASIAAMTHLAQSLATLFSAVGDTLANAT